MKAEAYTCDFCGELKHSPEVVGVLNTQDIFNSLDSYPTVGNPQKADIHYCISCFNTHAVNVADREVNRRKDERAWQLKLKEMIYIIKSQCVTNYLKKSKK